MEEHTKRPRKGKVQKATDEEKLESLGYEGDRPTDDIKSSLSRLKPIIMPVVLALAVSYFMISIIAVPKGTYNNAVAGLSNRMTTIETSIEEVVTGQEAMLTSIQSLQAELASYTPGTEQLDSLATELNNLKAQVAELRLDIPAQDNIIAIINSKFAAYEATHEAAYEAIIVWMEDFQEDLEERIAKLEEEDEGNDNDEVVIEVSTLAGMPLTFNGIPDIVSSGMVKIKITNNTGKDIKNIQLLAVFLSNQAFPAWADGYPQLLGTPTWTPAQVQDNALVFVTGWGYQGTLLDIEAGKSKTFYPQLTLKAATGEGVETRYFITTEVSIEDYD